MQMKQSSALLWQLPFLLYASILQDFRVAFVSGKCSCVFQWDEHFRTSLPCWVSRRSCCCSFSSVPTAVLQPQTWGTWRHLRAGLPISSGPGSSPGGLECLWWTPTGGCHGVLHRQRIFEQMFNVCLCVHMQAKPELNAKRMQNCLAVSTPNVHGYGNCSLAFWQSVQNILTVNIDIISPCLVFFAFSKKPPLPRLSFGGRPLGLFPWHTSFSILMSSSARGKIDTQILICYGGIVFIWTHYKSLRSVFICLGSLLE